jgi:hypothetical protein
MDNVSTKAVMTRTVAIFREHTAKPRELQILRAMELLAWRHFAAGCTVFFSLVGGSGEEDDAISQLINKIQNYCSGEWSERKEKQCII